MSLSIQADMPPLVESDDGIVRNRGTRIPLERVVDSFLSGKTLGQIVPHFDTLAIEDVDAVISYYLHHHAEVDAYVAAAEKEQTNLRQEIETVFDPAGIRSRMVARRITQAG